MCVCVQSVYPLFFIYLPTEPLKFTPNTHRTSHTNIAAWHRRTRVRNKLLILVRVCLVMSHVCACVCLCWHVYICICAAANHRLPIVYYNKLYCPSIASAGRERKRSAADRPANTFPVTVRPMSMCCCYLVVRRAAFCKPPN